MVEGGGSYGLLVQVDRGEGGLHETRYVLGRGYQVLVPIGSVGLLAAGLFCGYVCSYAIRAGADSSQVGVQVIEPCDRLYAKADLANGTLSLGYSILCLYGL